MTPVSGARLLRHLGDRVTFTLRMPQLPAGKWRAFLRTNLGRAQRLRDETIAGLGGNGTFAGASWRDIPMRQTSDGWLLDLPMTEIGYFSAKAYAIDDDGVQEWPTGNDIGVSIHPSDYRTANTVYCAFIRMFGRTKSATTTRDSLRDGMLAALDAEGYSVIPPSGTFRDLISELPHITERLGCTILHLLPVGPTPTTYARYGRFGSPYAQQDLTAIDPALVEYDKRTTAIDQFRELTAAAHLRGCRVFLDIVINHTGWGATLQDAHPEWFKRNADGTFHSPGAWGNTWEDLVELENSRPELWEVIAQALITWCRRGVNGFRCDAGYMVPLPAWQYIVCRVRQEFPRTVFLLEGLGGAWEATESLLTSGGMQWAYSELFQNFDAGSIGSYLLHCHGTAASRGVLIHYSETHDNDRLAKQGRAWSLLRNRLSALTSDAGAYGFTTGVEWLAREKLEVHQSRGLNWGASDHIVDELGTLNRLLANDPVFFDGAVITQIADPTNGVIALLRTPPATSGLATDRQVVVLINPDREETRQVTLPVDLWKTLQIELLGQGLPPAAILGTQSTITVPPLTAWCLASEAVKPGTGDDYRMRRSQAGAAYAALGHLFSNEDLGPADWRALAAWFAADPVRFLAAASHLDRTQSATDLIGALHLAAASTDLPPVVRWSAHDANRDLPVPPGVWILVREPAPFRITLSSEAGIPRHVESVAVDEGHVAALPPTDDAVWQNIELVRGEQTPVTGRVIRLRRIPQINSHNDIDLNGIALLTNGRGGMARLGIDLGRIQSKYDCLLGANLNPTAPSDRHVLAKRLRAWLNADGFVTPLDRHNLVGFEPGPVAKWRFVANAGDGRMVTIELDVDMLDGRNTTVVRVTRPDVLPVWGTPLPVQAVVKVILRVDVEDRSFHSETLRSPVSEAHFTGHTTALAGRAGFRFAPATDRVLTVWTDHGRFRGDEEWCTSIPHPIEAGRGMSDHGDAWSPGWFEVPLAPAACVHLAVSADQIEPSVAEIQGFVDARAVTRDAALNAAGFDAEDRFGRQLTVAAQSYLVRRDLGRTVIAGYPWFLDWGRDTFISARGLIAAGLHDDVRHLLTTFGRFESGGTLPNLLNGDRAENRDTSDAPLWYAVVLEELASALGTKPGSLLYQTKVDATRSLSDIIRSIACGYLAGTANGIRVDAASALVWSPPHFTWMDTNYPACTPREGYPIEIQVLWIRLLRQLATLRLPPAPAQPAWSALAETALASLLRYFWIEERGYFSDVLLGVTGTPAATAVRDDALRPNQIFAVSLGIISGDLARRCVAATVRHLVVPGAVRTLAPLPVSVPLVVRSAAGEPLNDPVNPYWGKYFGDEDTHRKPAYHNGTAWTWPFPSVCEAIAIAWGHTPLAVVTARSLLGSMDILIDGGCNGHLPEILDGDSPHQPRGCDAQAWGTTEALRVWKKLSTTP